MRPRRLLLPGLVLVLAGGCADRTRPSPVGPDAQSELSVELLRPGQNDVVIAGRSTPVEVVARDLNRLYLTGMGYVARRVEGGGLVDSVAVLFPAPRMAARDTFALAIPANYPTNTHIEIAALAFGVNGSSRATAAKQVVVAQCRDIPACQ